MMKILSMLLFIFLAIRSEVISQVAEVLHFYVEAGNYRRLNTPVSADLDGFLNIHKMPFQLFEKVNGKLIEKPYQVENGFVTRIWLILDGTTETGMKREFFLYKSEKSCATKNITVDVTSEEIILKKDNLDILHYQTALLYPPAQVDTVYKRSGFIHPLMTPAGNVLTRVNPPDHYHHLGIWNPWTKVKIGNHVTDFWNLGEKQGTVRFSSINSTVNGQVYGGFSVKQDHIDFQGTNREELVINEIWDIRAWNTEPLNGSKAYLVDLASFLSVAGDSSVTFQAYRYGGGIGIRANEEWTKDNSAVLTSEGKTRVDADGTHARWADINGEFKDNGQSGIIFFSHPGNREHPEPMRVWPMDANNGRGDLFFEFCPIRYTDWILDPGNIFRLKYRMLVYDGKIDRATAERLWNDFAYPPVVRVSDK